MGDITNYGDVTDLPSDEETYELYTVYCNIVPTFNRSYNILTIQIQDVMRFMASPFKYIYNVCPLIQPDVFGLFGHYKK